MKHKKRIIILAIIAAAVLTLVVLVSANLPKPVTASNIAFDLSQIADGSYIGACDNGLVKVQVEVRVQNHTITDVQILKHDNGLGTPAEAITHEIVQQQSVEIAAISGATLSSKTILKAVENALWKGQENK